MKCTCVSPDSEYCQFPLTCSVATTFSTPGDLLDSSNEGEISKKTALRSVGALIAPDYDWATAFHIGNNWVMTAGHVFADPAAGETSPMADAKSADSYFVMFNHEAGANPWQRIVCSLDPMHASGGKLKFHRVKDERFDFAVCRMSSYFSLNDSNPPANLAGEAVRAGDPVFLIHHGIQTRVKKVTAGHCTVALNQRIFLDFQAEFGASGGLLVNGNWEAIGVMVDGQSNMPFAYSLDSIYRQLPPDIRDDVGLPASFADKAEVITAIGRPTPTAKQARFGLATEKRRQLKLSPPVSKGCRSVCKVFSPGVGIRWSEQGTGFVVADGWLLTARHVVSCAEAAAFMKFDFNFDGQRELSEPNAECKQRPGGAFYASYDGFDSCDGVHYYLDYALFQIMPTHEEYEVGSPIQLATDLPEAGSEVFIIAHAALSNFPEKGVLQNQDASGNWITNTFRGSDEQHIYHLAARTGGSSGAPILNSNGEAFGMHTHEVGAHDDKPLQRSYHWGTKLSAVARDLKIRIPSIVTDHPGLEDFLNLAN